MPDPHDVHDRLDALDQLKRLLRVTDDALVVPAVTKLLLDLAEAERKLADSEPKESGWGATGA